MNSNKKYDFYKNSVYYLIASAVIMLVALIVICVCGFNHETSISGSHLLLTSVLSVLISSLAVFLYVGFRYDFGKAFSILCSIVHNVLLSTALVAIVRVPVTEAILMGYLLMVGLTTLCTLMLTEKLEDVNIKKVDYNEIIKKSMNKNVKTILLVSVIVLTIMLLSVLTLNSNLFAFARILLVTVLVIIYSTLTFILPSWFYFSQRIKKVKRAKVDTNIENQKVVKAVTLEGEAVGSATIDERE